MPTPNSSLRRIFGQAPPTDLRSTAATRCPRLAKVRRAVSSRGRCEVRKDRRLPAVLENPYVLFSIVGDALELARHSISSGDRTLTGCSFEICPSFAAAECHRLPASYHCIPNTKKERLASRAAIELSCFPFCRTSSQDRPNLNRQLTNLRRMPNSDGNWSQALSNHLVSRYADRRMHFHSTVYWKTPAQAIAIFTAWGVALKIGMTLYCHHASVYSVCPSVWTTDPLGCESACAVILKDF